jgi:hypothetical protein
MNDKWESSEIFHKTDIYNDNPNTENIYRQGRLIGCSFLVGRFGSRFAFDGKITEQDGDKRKRFL